MNNDRVQGGETLPPDHHHHLFLTPGTAASSHNAAAYYQEDTLPHHHVFDVAAQSRSAHQPPADYFQVGHDLAGHYKTNAPQLRSSPPTHDTAACFDVATTDAAPAALSATLKAAPHIPRNSHAPLGKRRRSSATDPPLDTSTITPAKRSRPTRRPGPEPDPPMSSNQAELSVLNAQQYDTALAEPRPAGPPASRKPTRSTESAPKARQKRAIPVDDVDEDALDNDDRRKRSRGRPRLDTTDETAADRRRTQIRLAQRAYRNRKDTAIETLKVKVNDLQKANDSMSKQFSNFYDLAVSQGMLDVAPELADRLKDMTDKFLSLAQKQSLVSEDDEVSGSRSSEVDENDRPEDTDRRKTKSATGSSHRSTSESNMDARRASVPHLGEANLSAGFESSGSGLMPPPTLPYEVITQPTADNASFPMQLPIESFNDFFNATSHPPPYLGPPAPQSYAYQEPTFGKRLQRTASEAGLRLVSMANPPPGRYAAVFGFSLLFETRDAIFNRLSSGLKRPREESLNIWTVPFTNLGGAGMFFQDDSPEGRSLGGGLPVGNEGMREVHKPQDANGFSMGPFDARVESARELVDGRMRMKYAGFEGDFFDSEEIEIYLRKRGIVIPPQADFVDVEIDLDQLENGDELSLMGDANIESMYGGPGDAAGGGFSNSGGNMWPSNTGSAASSDFAASLPMFSNQGAGVTQLDAGMVQYMCPSIPQRPAQSFPTRSNIKATLNVQTLIVEMVGKSICIGRTSAVRPKDIDRAVKIASGLVLAPLHKLV